MSSIHSRQYFPFLTKLDGISTRYMSQQLHQVIERLWHAFFTSQIVDGFFRFLSPPLYVKI